MFLPQGVNTKLENADGNYIADFETSASPKFQNRQKFGTKCALISIRKTMAKRGNEVERNEAARSCKKVPVELSNREKSVAKNSKKS